MPLQPEKISLSLLNNLFWPVMKLSWRRQRKPVKCVYSTTAHTADLADRLLGMCGSCSLLDISDCPKNTHTDTHTQTILAPQQTDCD